MNLHLPKFYVLNVFHYCVPMRFDQTQSTLCAAKRFGAIPYAFVEISGLQKRTDMLP